MAELYEDLTLIRNWEAEGIYILKPRCGATATKDGPLYQATELAKRMPFIVDDLGAKTVCWDTITATGLEMLDEMAQSGLHASSAGTKRMAVKDTNVGFFGTDRRDYLAVQSRLRMNVRLPLLKNPAKPSRDYHLWVLSHLTEKLKTIGQTKQGEAIQVPETVGPSVCGRANVEEWGKEFGAQWQVYLDPAGKRRIRIDKEVIDKVTYMAHTRGGILRESSLPWPNSTAGMKDTMGRLLDIIHLDTANPKTGYGSFSLGGLQGVGKTMAFSVFLMFPNTKPLIYVAADGDSEFIRPFADEVKVVGE